MARAVYLSFLGAGVYRPVRYTWDRRQAKETPYAQEAELELLPKQDEVYIFATQTSERAHWLRQTHKDHQTKQIIDEGPGLRPRLEALGVQPHLVLIDEDLSVHAQWETFQKLLEIVQPGDQLIFDMTHGFRAVPVIFSSALHFLRLSRGVELKHVLYGKEKDPAQIIDYVDFYAIQDWTEGVSRLVESADAGKLAALSAQGSTLPMSGFEGAPLTQALDAMTQAVRNVEVHQVEAKTRAALQRVREALNTATAQNATASTLLLQMIEEKFSAILSAAPLTGAYDRDYFEVQLKVIDLLLEHQMLMQAFTSMREYLGSLGLLGYQKKLKFNNSKGQGKRSYADVFLRMISYPRDSWSFESNDQKRQVEGLLPFYECLASAELVGDFSALTKDITDIRNGFDHAWTSKSAAPADIEQTGRALSARLKALTARVFEVSSAR